MQFGHFNNQAPTKPLFSQHMVVVAGNFSVQVDIPKALPAALFRYSVHRLLGHGSSAICVAATCLDSKCSVAIKLVRKVRLHHFPKASLTSKGTNPRVELEEDGRPHSTFRVLLFATITP